MILFINKNSYLIANITLTPDGRAYGLALSANKSLLFIANLYNMHIYNVTTPQVYRKKKKLIKSNDKRIKQTNYKKYCVLLKS